MTDTDKLYVRVLALEEQLDRYHERLEACLDHDRQFQLKASWGIVNVACGISASVAVYYVARKWLHLEGELLEWIITAVAVVAFFAGMLWSDHGREKDAKKLSRLPKWERPQL